MTISPSTLCALFAVAGILAPSAAQAMCGCMVAPRPPRKQNIATPEITNESSKVALVRIDDTTVITMANDVKTKASDFAMIVPVPSKIRRKQVSVVNGKLFARLAQISAPKLIERYDPEPCATRVRRRRPSAMADNMSTRASGARPRTKARDFGVKVEAVYEVGEYQIAILAANEGDGLMQWLNRFHYDVPAKAVPVLQSYIKQGNRFFVARVNLGKLSKKKRRGFTQLRPLQVHFDTPKFGLPIRLGMVNAKGPQELTVYAVSDRGRVQTSNYRTQRIPETRRELPLYIKSDFSKFYGAVFENATEKQGMQTIFTEAVVPQLRRREAKRLGVNKALKGRAAKNLVMTRLHFRYDNAHFPEDLALQATGDRRAFRPSYVVSHAAKNTSCSAGRRYLKKLEARKRRRAKQLAALTGWPIRQIQRAMSIGVR